MRRVALLVTMVVITASYLASSFLVAPVGFLTLSIENFQLSKDGLWLNFTVVIRNGGIWPLVLDKIHLNLRDRDGKPIIGFPNSLTLLPLQAIGIKGLGAYASDCYVVSSCCPGIEARVLTLNLEGYALSMTHVFGVDRQTWFNIQGTSVLQ